MTPEDQLAHFLYKPRTVPGPETTASYSSLWLALFDARVASGRDRESGSVSEPDPPTKWLGAIGYLVLFDLLGDAVKRVSRPSSSNQAVHRTLEAFSQLTQPEREVMYALRNALAHDYSLVNPGAAGKHLFRLEWNGVAPLVTLPSTPWDGDYANAGAADETVVNLFGVTQLGEDVVEEVLSAHGANDLELAVGVDEAESRYFITIN